MSFLILAVPVIAALLMITNRIIRRMHIISLAASGTMLVSAIPITSDILAFGKIESSFMGGFLYLDALSVIVLDIVVLIGFLACIYSVGYLKREILLGAFDFKRVRLYYVLMFSFMFTMLLALSVKNVGIMWIAIEATTLASAFLVGFYNDRYALEAAWKYIMICSVGIALAMLGIIFLNLSAMAALDSSAQLDWTALMDNAGSLKPSSVRLAFIFILVGFGTKAGLAPMHTWLPDAHSQAPAPISALLSGVLLNSAMYGIIRITAVTNKNMGSSEFSGNLLILLGMLSILTASVFILTQRDYESLLAYSSIEHMGIIAVAIGFFTPASIFGGLFHMLNHSLTKSMLFFCSGTILQKYGTRQITKIKGAIKLLPYTGTAFLLGLFAIAGTPPFSIFASEFSIMSAIFKEGDFIIGSVLIMLLAFVFAGIAIALFRIFYGTSSMETPQPGEINIPGTIAALILLLMISTMGLLIPEQLKELLHNAQNIIYGS